MLPKLIPSHKLRSLSDFRVRAGLNDFQESEETKRLLHMQRQVRVEVVW